MGHEFESLASSFCWFREFKIS